jgi:hypothetical protein
MADDWAWPALIQSLQRDIEHLRGAVDDMRRESVQSRERHRDELDGLIDQLREVRTELDPILEERQAGRDAKREMVWGWLGKAGWIALIALGVAAWHYLTEHTRP